MQSVGCSTLSIAPPILEVVPTITLPDASMRIRSLSLVFRTSGVLFLVPTTKLFLNELLSTLEPPVPRYP